MQDYEIDALKTAQTALIFLDADNFSAYNRNKIKLQELIDEWQKITDTYNRVGANKNFCGRG